MTKKPVQSKFGIILILVLLNKDLVRGEDRGVTWKTKLEKLRKDYRTYIFQNSISLLVQMIPKRNPNITNKLNKFLVYACMLADVYFTCSIFLVIISFILQGETTIQIGHRPPYISDSFNKIQPNSTKNTLK